LLSNLDILTREHYNSVANEEVTDMGTAEITAEDAGKRRFSLTACGPTGRLTKEAFREVLIVYGCAIALRIAVKIWARLSLKGEITPSTSALLLGGALIAAGYAAFLFWRIARRKDYWPIFGGGALAFAAFFRFDKAPIAAGTALEKPLILLPILPAALATWAFLAMIRETDELERRINYQALSFAFVVTFSACLAWALLEDLGLPRVSSFYWWLLLAISWGVGLAIYSRKYR
jgi:hypothetical protein